MQIPTQVKSEIRRQTNSSVKLILKAKRRSFLESVELISTPPYKPRSLLLIHTIIFRLNLISHAQNCYVKLLQ
jgi:hypothetical protein